MRVNLSEFKIQSGQESLENKYYTLSDTSSFLDEEGYPQTDKDSANIYAKAIKEKKTKNIQNKSVYYRYFILADKNRTLYNPTKLYSVTDQNSTTHDFVNSVCKEGFQFVEVSHDVFKNYLLFLKTSSKKFLTQAQRDIV